MTFKVGVRNMSRDKESGRYGRGKNICHTGNNAEPRRSLVMFGE